jgi:hypothetical protein
MSNALLENESATDVLAQSWNQQAGAQEPVCQESGKPPLGPAVTIDPEFKALIPSLTTEEYAALEASLQQEGCRDAFVVWKGHDVLLDAHNRYAICQKHGIEYRLGELDLPNRDAAKEWIVRNQLGRRNLSPFARAELVAHLKESVAARAKENQKGGMKSDKPIDTKKEMAKLAGMSHDTWEKAEDLIKRAPEDTKKMLRAGETSINCEWRSLDPSMRDPSKKKKRAAPKQPKSKNAWSVPAGLRVLLKDIAKVHGYNSLDDCLEDMLDFIDGEGKETWERWAEARRPFAAPATAA